jgi:hypothetical protein
MCAVMLNMLNNRILLYLLLAAKQHAIWIALTLVSTSKVFCSMNIHKHYT